MFLEDRLFFFDFLRFLHRTEPDSLNYYTTAAIMTADISKGVKSFYKFQKTLHLL